MPAAPPPAPATHSRTPCSECSPRRAPVVALDNSFFYSAFAQDDWRIRPNLTINLGVRWDIQTPPTDPQNKESIFIAGRQSTVNPLMPAGELVVGDQGVGRGAVPIRLQHVSPRVGFAYDPFGNGKTSIRASAGLFWGSVSGNEWSTTSNFYPFSLRYTFPVPGTLTNPYLTRPRRFLTSTRPDRSSRSSPTGPSPASHRTSSGPTPIN